MSSIAENSIDRKSFLQLLCFLFLHLDSSFLFKKTFLAFIHRGHDPSIVTRVKSQCALLRANIDELEKNKKSSTSVAPKLDRVPRTIISRTFNIDRNVQMKFYQRLIEESQGDESSDEAMQED